MHNRKVVLFNFIKYNKLLKQILKKCGIGGMESTSNRTNITNLLCSVGHAVAYLGEALCYKPDFRGIEHR
jgi:hypothetical protein